MSPGKVITRMGHHGNMVKKMGLGYMGTRMGTDNMVTRMVPGSW